MRVTAASNNTVKKRLAPLSVGLSLNRLFVRKKVNSSKVPETYTEIEIAIEEAAQWVAELRSERFQSDGCTNAEITDNRVSSC